MNAVPLFKITAALPIAAMLALSGCGGGGGSASGAPKSPGGNPTPTLAEIRTLTDAAAPTETDVAQAARSPGIVSRADSLLITTVHGESSLSELPIFTLRASCSGTVCTLSEPRTGVSETIRLSDLESVSGGNHQPVGTKHGVTLVRSSGRHEGTDYFSLGAWMQHSAFGVQMERGTVEGVRVDIRYGIAGGDLTGSQPSGSATWRGLMTGTPATGAGRGDRLQGDASLIYDMGSRMLDAAFTNIQNIDRLRAHSVSSVRFTGVPVNARGAFQAGLTGNRIEGGFYGPDHAEAAGVFEQQNIVGAFGARQ